MFLNRLDMAQHGTPTIFQQQQQQYPPSAPTPQTTIARVGHRLHLLRLNKLNRQRPPSPAGRGGQGGTDPTSHVHTHPTNSDLKFTQTFTHSAAPHLSQHTRARAPSPKLSSAGRKTWGTRLSPTPPTSSRASTDDTHAPIPLPKSLQSKKILVNDKKHATLARREIGHTLGSLHSTPAHPGSITFPLADVLGAVDGAAPNHTGALVAASISLELMVTAAVEMGLAVIEEHPTILEDPQHSTSMPEEAARGGAQGGNFTKSDDTEPPTRRNLESALKGTGENGTMTPNKSDIRTPTAGRGKKPTTAGRGSSSNPLLDLDITGSKNKSEPAEEPPEGEGEAMADDTAVKAASMDRLMAEIEAAEAIGDKVTVKTLRARKAVASVLMGNTPHSHDKPSTAAATTQQAQADADFGAKYDRMTQGLGDIQEDLTSGAIPGMDIDSVDRDPDARRARMLKILTGAALDEDMDCPEGEALFSIISESISVHSQGRIALAEDRWLAIGGKIMIEETMNLITTNLSRMDTEYRRAVEDGNAGESVIYIEQAHMASTCPILEGMGLQRALEIAGEESRRILQGSLDLKDLKRPTLSAVHDSLHGSPLQSGVLSNAMNVSLPLNALQRISNSYGMAPSKPIFISQCNKAGKMLPKKNEDPIDFVIRVTTAFECLYEDQIELAHTHGRLFDELYGADVISVSNTALTGIRILINAQKDANVNNLGHKYVNDAESFCDQIKEASMLSLQEKYEMEKATLIQVSRNIDAIETSVPTFRPHTGRTIKDKYKGSMARKPYRESSRMETVMLAHDTAKKGCAYCGGSCPSTTACPTKRFDREHGQIGCFATKDYREYNKKQGRAMVERSSRTAPLPKDLTDGNKHGSNKALKASGGKTKAKAKKSSKEAAEDDSCSSSSESEDQQLTSSSDTENSGSEDESDKSDDDGVVLSAVNDDGWQLPPRHKRPGSKLRRKKN